MVRLPRTKDEILDTYAKGTSAPKDALEEAIPLFLEVLLDIRDNMEFPTIIEGEDESL